MSAPICRAHLRVARPTDDVAALRTFYCTGLGFDVIWEFKDHEGFDGLMVGFESMGYHLEFTRKHGHNVGKAPTEDNLLVFYLPDTKTWEESVEKMRKAGYDSVKAFNPYWDVRGRTFEDPDGYRVVLQNAGWTNKKWEKK